MAFSRAKMHWVKMDAVKLVNEGLPAGKEHHMPKLYFDNVLEGSRIVRNNVPRMLYFHEYIHGILCCNMKQDLYVI